MPLAKLCAEMGWGSDYDAPPFDMTHYCVVSRAWRAIRQRWNCSGGTTDEIERAPGYWPPGNSIWDSGVIQSIADNGDGTFTLVDDRLDSLGSPRHAWVDTGDIQRWANGFGGTFNGENISDPVTCAPGSYRVVIFPLDDGDPPANSISDANRGIVLGPVLSNGSNSLTLAQDGRMLLNGESLSDYEGFGFHIIRMGVAGGYTRGWGWIERFPPAPNFAEIDYGLATAATTTTLTDARDGSANAWKTPKSLRDAVGKDLICQLSGSSRWVRLAVTAVSASGTGGSSNMDTLHFAAQATAPALVPWYLVEPGKWFRPEGAILMTLQHGRGGPFWDSSGSGRWRPWATWYGGNLTLDVRLSHRPTNDTLAAYGLQARTVTIDDGTGDPPEFHVFDNDAISERQVAPDQTCNVSDLLFSPPFYFGLRGVHHAADDLFGGIAWVEDKDYAGKKSVPLLTRATWQKLYNAGNTVTTTVDSVSDPLGGDAIFPSAITLPTITPQAGEYTSLPVDWTLLDADLDDEVIDSGTGTVTSTELSPGGTFGGFDDSHVGKRIVIAFGRTRRHARRISHLYERSVAEPEVGDGGGAVWPPTPANPGGYATTLASTNYAEFSDVGELGDTGSAFVDGETARYLPDHWHAPSLPAFTSTGDALAPYADLAYQGLPAPISAGSTFPRWEGSARGGTISAVDPGQFADDSQLWWVGTATSYLHSGAADGGSDTSHLIVSTLDADELEFWNSRGGARFTEGGGMILEVELDPSGAPGVYTRRPITAQDMSGTPTLTVSPPFPATIAGLAWQIREPGYSAGRGAILNLWRGRKVKITKADGSGSRVIVIQRSDDKRCYYTEPGGGFTIAVGDRYEIRQLEPGSTVQRSAVDPTSLDEINGWVLTDSDLATPDTRGHDWITAIAGNIPGNRNNLPTVVNAYGNYCKGDYPLFHLWHELKESINILTAARRPMDWDSRSPANYLSATAEDNSKQGGGGFLTGPDAPTYGADDTDQSGLFCIGKTVNFWSTFATAFETRSAAPSSKWINTINGPFSASRRYAYGVTSSLTEMLKCSIDLYAAADGPINNDEGPLVIGVGGGLKSEFDPFGSGLVLGKFALVETLPAAATLERRGTTAFPNADLSLLPTPENIVYGGVNPGDPYYPSGLAPGYTDLTQGFDVSRAVAVARFAVSGGLTYL